MLDLLQKIEVNFSFFRSIRSKKPLSICQRTIKHLKKCYKIRSFLLYILLFKRKNKIPILSKNIIL